MRKERRKYDRKIAALLSGAAAIAASIMVVCAAAWAKTTATVTNRFETGVVDISLEEYQVDEQGEEIKSQDDAVILPGMTVSRLVRIKNLGDDCFIRAKAFFSGTEELDQNCLIGISDDWVEAQDGFFYYRPVLKAGDSAEFFQGIVVPRDFSPKDETEKILLNLEAGAVQNKNVIPDFEAEKPWGEIQVESAVKCGTSREAVRTSEGRRLIVEYEEDTAQIITNEQDFFVNMPQLMPGDRYTDEAALSNTGRLPVRVWFHSLAEENTEFCEQIGLVIETEVGGNHETVYSGKLADPQLSEDILLTELPARGSGRMIFTLSVPEDLGNENALWEGTVRWVFSAEETREENGRNNLPVDTGDRGRAAVSFAAAVVSFGAAVFVIRKKRRNERE